MNDMIYTFKQYIIFKGLAYTYRTIIFKQMFGTFHNGF